MRNAVWERLTALSEDELRLEVIIPMLERTPGLEQVTDVHGVNERGLDVIFFTVDHIRRTCYAIQLKRGDISGGGSRDKTVHQIINFAGGANCPRAYRRIATEAWSNYVEILDLQPQRRCPEWAWPQAQGPSPMRALILREAK